MPLRHLLVSLVLFILLPGVGSAQSNYTLINDATVYSGCNCYQLTPDQGNQGGGVYQNNTINLNNSFDFTFNVFLGCNTSNGADGMVFILTNNITGIGTQGGGLGYSGLSGNSVGIEYDTYQNGWDPPYNHIAIEYGGQVEHPTGTLAGPISALPSAANIDDCNWHTTRITWNVATQTYSVYFDGNLRLSYTMNMVATYFAGNPIVNWGWSGSTGGDENFQRFCVTSISSWVAGTDYETCNDSVQFHDVSTSNLGSVQSWAWNFGDPASGANNTSSLQNPIHVYSSAGTYTVSLIITDITGCADTFSHAVTIAPPITITDTLNEPLCNGAATGSIHLGSSGGFGAAAGFGGYSYDWSNAITVADEVGVTSGTYDVTVSDGVCSATGTYTLNQPPPLTATTSSTDANCGLDNGSVTLAISGGTPPYNGVTWDGVPGYTLTGLGAGTYVANFHDANGCSALLTYTAVVGTLPCGYTTSTSSTNVTCFGGSNGSVTLTVTGTVGTATITWDNSSGTQVGTGATVTGLPAGTYTYHYVDGLPTTFTGTVVVTQPGGAMTTSLSTVNTTCSYLNNGSAVVSVTANGTPNYGYLWSAAGQPNAATATGLSPGPISVTVTDANGCTSVATGNVNGQPVLSPSVTTVPDSCFGNSTGKAIVSVTGGTPVYSYVWSNTAIGDTNFNIAQGPYTVTVTDHNGCTATASGTVNQPPILAATTSQVNVACYGAATGTATVFPTGGNGGFTYLWSNAATTVTATGLSDGTYYVTVTDSKRCGVIDSVTLTQPTRLSPTYTLDSITCHGLADGSITVTTTGGTSPYTYALDGSGTYQASGTFSGLSAGAHTVTVKDANTCDSIISFTIYQPPLLTSSITYTRGAACNGNCNGSILAAGAGGTPPYTYSIDGVTYTSVDSFTSLCAGPYTITVKDANGCTSPIATSVSQPAALSLAVTSITEPSCFGGSNGQIVVAASGGTAPYQYDINLGTPQLSGTFSGLSAGLYILGTGDANVCLDSLHIILAQPALLVADTLSTREVSCFGGNNGAITLGVSGGTYPFTYVWTGAASGITDSLGINLVAGTYSAYITDAKGCKDTVTATITQPTRLSPTYTLDSITCNGLNNGSITVTTTGGTSPYTYALDGSGTYQASGTFSGLSAGAHTVTVKDANSCDSIITFTIYQPPALTASITYTRDASCNGTCNGSILAAGGGGTPPYTYSTDGVTFTAVDSFTGLCAGPYTITIKDAKGCTTTAPTTVTQPPVLVVAPVDSAAPGCNNGTNGSYTVSASGGTPGYTYSNNGGLTYQASGTYTNQTAGPHTVTAKDANGCTATYTITVPNPPATSTFDTATTPVSCFGGSNGAITTTITGTTTPYSYTWTPGGATTSGLTGIPAGLYIVQITDGHGCQVFGPDSITVSQPTRLSPTFTMDSITCSGTNNGSITVTTTGGTGPYQYALDGSGTYQASGTFAGLSGGAHTVTVQDANLCDSIVSFTIYQPTPLSASITYTINASCNGVCNGSIMASGAGGTAPYTYSIDGVTYTTVDSFTALCANPYTITVKDANGCTATAPATITQPNALVLSLVSATPPLCFGGSTGQIVVSATGGTSPYLYDINLGAPQATGTFNNLATGLYIVGVGDAHLCLDTLHILLNQPAQLVADTISTQQISCFNGNNGAITLGVSGGTYPYTYVWPTAPAITDSLGVNLTAGTYTTNITDANGCTTSVTTVLGQPSQLSPVITQLDSVSCFGGTDGGVIINTSGGTSPYQYALDGSGTYQSSGVFSGLSAGAHTVTVQDANGCDSIVSFNISQPALVSASIANTINDSCFGQCDGVIIALASGGTPPYQYSIDGVNYFPSDTFTGLCANPSYTIHVQDANGCPGNTSASISQPAAVVVSPVDSFPPTCFDGTNGTFDVTASGGSGAGYTYSLNGGPFAANGGNFTSVSPGPDTVTAKDANGCTGMYIITVPNTVATSSFTTAPIEDSCFGGSTGSITVTVTGTVTPYSFLWSNGATSQNLTSIPTGTYTVEVKDANGCVVYGADSTNTITQPQQISATNVMTPVTCFGDSNGCITVTPSGGTQPFTHSWTNGATTNNPCQLMAGAYSDTITDSYGCQYIYANVPVTQPSQIALIIDSVTPVACAGDSNGAIMITDTGGTPAYNYVWSNNTTAANASGLKDGTYTVTVTDSHNCSVTGTASVGVVNPMLLNAQKNDVLCPPLQNGYISLPVTGGTPGYQFTWSNGSNASTLSGLPVGDYNVTVTDSRGCTIDTSFVIINDSAFSMTAIPDTATINEGDNVQLGLAIVSNGAGNPATITWTPSDGLSCSDCQGPLATPFVTTQYVVTAVSDSGCTAVSQTLITVNPQHQIYVPNAFTPNGDGINDYWAAFGNKAVWKFCEATVWDRWGETVFQSNDIDFQWDGRYRGEYVEPGEYVYTFKVVFIDDYSVSNKGSITVIR